MRCSACPPECGVCDDKGHCPDHCGKKILPRYFDYEVEAQHDLPQDLPWDAAHLDQERARFMAVCERVPGPEPGTTWAPYAVLTHPPQFDAIWIFDDEASARRVYDHLLQSYIETLTFSIRSHASCEDDDQ